MDIKTAVTIVMLITGSTDAGMIKIPFKTMTGCQAEAQAFNKAHVKDGLQMQMAYCMRVH